MKTSKALGRILFVVTFAGALGAIGAGPAAGQVPRRAETLGALSSQLSAEAARQRARVDSLVAVTGVERRVVIPLGDTTETVYELVGLEDTRPVFLGTHNAAAARTVRAHRLSAGGGLGVDVRGDGLVLGIWDGGVAFTGHREFGARAERVDATGSVTNHATHVAGTMIAAGVAAEARGVAPLARVRSWDWSDDANEMAQAALEGMYASNHSYGSLGGWAWNVRNTGRWAWMGDPEDVTDWKFGAYDGRAAAFDAVAAAAPEYVIVRSAGNERADRGPAPGTPHDYFFGGWKVTNRLRSPDGGESGFDTLLDAGNAKNVLVVGAVEDVLVDEPTPSDIRLLALSSMGPTNDGRIKPDVVASGHEVWSSVATGTAAYAWSSGTSMAAPAVAGVAGLLQRLFEQTIGRRPSSALIRGLLIHTADEAGPHPGPDYRHGWGLVNAGRAASHLLAHRSESPTWLEASVAPGSDFETGIDVGADGILRVTLAWTDPAGTVQTAPPSGSLTHSVLVHDLDLEVYGLGPTPYLPWVLSLNRPADAAWTGRNPLDNVEQVFRDGLAPGRYRVRVLHRKGAAAQAFALLLGESSDGPPPAPSISGRLVLDGIGLRGVEVAIDGPTNARTTTGPDGRFLFDAIAPGRYVVRPDRSFYDFAQEAREVGVVAGNHTADFTARPAVRLAGRAFFPADRLFGPDGWDTSVEATSLTAGGVYGVRLDLDASLDLEGGRIDLDLDFDSQMASWAGEIGRQVLGMAESWTISRGGPTGYHHWIPAIWTSFRAPEGHRARVPLRVFDAGGRLVGADTLRWTVGLADAVPPVPFAVIPNWGRGFVEVGTTVILEMHLLDGSPITRAQLVVRDRNEPSVEITRLALYDDGAYRLHFDEIADDRRFAAAFTPRIEADFRFDLVAEDERGNVTEREGVRFLSSVPFRTSNERLLVAWSETESRTSAHAALLDSAGLGVDAWEYDVRGAVTGEALSAYRLVVWARGDRGFDQAPEREALMRAVEGGTPLLAMGAGVASPDATGWTIASLHAEPLGPLPTPTGTGDPAGLVEGESSMPGWSGVRFRLRPGARLGHVEPAQGAAPLLRVRGRVVAWRHVGVPGRVVGLTFSPLDLEEPADAGRLVRWLLADAENDPGLAPVPAGTDLVSPADANLGLPAGRIDLAWREQPHATYRIEVSASGSFESPLVQDTRSAPPYPFDLAEPGLVYRWRVRAVSPAGAGPWSDVRLFGVPLENRPPVVVTAPPAVSLRERGHAALLDPAPWFVDPDGEALGFSAFASDSSVVVATIAEGRLRLRPHGAGRAVVVVQAESPDGTSASLLLDVVVDANRLPGLRVEPEAVALIVGGPARQISAVSDDPDGDPVEIRVEAVPPELVGVDRQENVFTLQAAVAGSGVFRVTATDTLGGSTSIEVPISVRGNLAPAFTVPDAGVKAFLGSAVTLVRSTLLADPDGDALTLSAVAAPDGIVEVTVTDTSLVVVPLRLGRADVRLTGADPYGLSTESLLSVLVGPDPGDGKPAPGRWAVAAVYPVPASNVLHVLVDVPAPGTVTFELIDMLGRRRLHRSEAATAGRPRFALETAGIASGVYRLRVTTPRGVFLRSIVITR